MIIISKGKIVATDTVDNLTNRLRGSESIAVAVEPRNGATRPAAVQQRLEQVPGVSRVLPRESESGRLVVRTRKPAGPRDSRRRGARGGRAGGILTELRPVALSLEEVFLQLTGTEQNTEQNNE